MHVLVAVVEIELPAWQGIGHHQIYIAVLTWGRLARAWLADRPLRQRTSRECHSSRHAYEEKLENPAHADLLSVEATNATLALKSPGGKVPPHLTIDDRGLIKALVLVSLPRREPTLLPLSMSPFRRSKGR
jgi:hypothetical protein